MNIGDRKEKSGILNLLTWHGLRHSEKSISAFCIMGISNRANNKWNLLSNDCFVMVPGAVCS